MRNWLKRFFSKSTVIKLHYSERRRANRAFNTLMSFFVKHRGEYRVLKSKIYDCSPCCSTTFEWCVYFKFADTDRPSTDQFGESSDVSDFIESARKEGML